MLARRARSQHPGGGEKAEVLHLLLPGPRRPRIKREAECGEQMQDMDKKGTQKWTEEPLVPQGLSKDASRDPEAQAAHAEDRRDGSRGLAQEKGLAFWCYGEGTVKVR